MQLNRIYNNLRIYNSISKNKEIFKPINKDYIGMYVCGPTVYNQIHLGNCRTFISFDVVFRYLKHIGYNVRYVRNLTDVGHLENDLEEGEDKIAKKARMEFREPMEIALKYSLDFHHILNLFKTLPPSIEPIASGHILEQIDIIKKLLKKGGAYQVNGSVYFDVKFYKTHNNYGIFSNNLKIEYLLSNSKQLKYKREKKNTQDFALWKKSYSKHLLKWSSPWGDGFPGWHLECTAMSLKYLGKIFDIHCGGIDLKFPHHECEIAQFKYIYNKNIVLFWMHTNLLTLNGNKMSKSTGNLLLPNDIFNGKTSFLKKSFSPAVIRFFMLQSHYRSVLDISNQALLSAEISYDRLIEAFHRLKKMNITNNISTFNVYSWRIKCYEAMNDDFNSPVLIYSLFIAVQLIQDLISGKENLSFSDFNLLKETMYTFIFDILGLSFDSTFKETEYFNLIKDLVKILIKIRNKARIDKKWDFSDKIRQELLKRGISLNDRKNETTFCIKNA